MWFRGRFPFKAANIQDLIKVVMSTLPDVSGLTPEETVLINGLIEKDISKRLGYHSGIDRLKALEFFADVDWEKVKSRDLVAPIEFSESYYID
jgi:hypothetical protein